MSRCNDLRRNGNKYSDLIPGQWFHAAVSKERFSRLIVKIIAMA